MTLDTHFVRKGCRGHLETAMFPQFLTLDTDFVRKAFTFRGDSWPLKREEKTANEKKANEREEKRRETDRERYI